MSRRGRALLICGLCLALAACAGESGPGSKPLPGTPASSGSFKVGNPYTIDGTWYYPVVDWNYDETGIASWYGPDFHGKATANGEPYDMNGLTAAHRTLPIPSIVQVTNLDNGQTAMTVEFMGLCAAISVMPAPYTEFLLARARQKWALELTIGGKFEPAMGPATLCGLALETDDATGLARRVAAVRLGGRLEQARPAFWG